MSLEQWCFLCLTRPSLQQTGQRVVVSGLFFYGMNANNRDGALAIVSGSRSGFAGNPDRWLFFFVARLFFVHAGNRHGCSILVWDSLDLPGEFDDKPCSGRISWQRFPPTQYRVSTWNNEQK